MKTCLIIGNGPSLADIPNEFLAKYPTFGSNRIYLKYTPDYYAFVDRLWIANYLDDINALKSTRTGETPEKFIRCEFAKFVPGSHPMNNTSKREFSYEPLKWCWDGCTVTFVHLRLAFFYGFERVLMIGVDHYYDKKGAVGAVCMGRDTSHFTKDYYDEHVSWWQPNLDKFEISYKLAKKAYEEAGREVINITPKTRLDVFRKDDWKKWM